MATLEQIGGALQAAHAAGDTESARRLAQAYSEMKAAQPAPVEAPKAEDNGNFLSNAVYGMAGRGHEMATALNPFATEQDVQNRAAEKEWINQHSGAGVGSMVTDMISMAPAALAAPEIASSVLGSGLMGAAQAHLTTAGSLDDRANAGMQGGIGGLAGGVIGKALPYAATVVDRIAAPFHDAGKKQVLSRMLQSATGDNADIIASRLDNAKSLVPGSMPTAAEAADSGGISAIQRWAEQANPENYQFRRTQNANARTAAIDNIAGDKTDMARSVAMRSELAGPFYEAARGQSVPVDAELRKLLQRPSMQTAMDHAERISAEMGRPVDPAMKAAILNGTLTGEISGDALHWLKVGLDSAAKDPKNPLAGQEKRALDGTIKSFESWRESAIPDYAAGQKVYADLSGPINRMEVGGELANKLNPALTDYGNLTRETAQKYASALRDGDLTAKKATGYSGSTLDNTLTKGEMGSINAVGKDLARKAAADENGRGIGSNTFQNFAMQDLGNAAGMPGHLVGALTHVPVVGGLLSSLAKSATHGAEDDMKSMLSDALLDPKKTAELLRLSQNRGLIPNLFNNKKLQAIPGIMGASSANQLNQ